MKDVIQSYIYEYTLNDQAVKNAAPLFQSKSEQGSRVCKKNR